MLAEQGPVSTAISPKSLTLGIHLLLGCPAMIGQVRILGGGIACIHRVADKASLLGNSASGERPSYVGLDKASAG